MEVNINWNLSDHQINVGQEADDGTGDSKRQAGEKINLALNQIQSSLQIFNHFVNIFGNADEDGNFAGVSLSKALFSDETDIVPNPATRTLTIPAETDDGAGNPSAPEQTITLPIGDLAEGVLHQITFSLAIAHNQDRGNNSANEGYLAELEIVQGSNVLFARQLINAELTGANPQSFNITPQSSDDITIKLNAHFTRSYLRYPENRVFTISDVELRQVGLLREPAIRLVKSLTDARFSMQEAMINNAIHDINANKTSIQAIQQITSLIDLIQREIDEDATFIVGFDANGNFSDPVKTYEVSADGDLAIGGDGLLVNNGSYKFTRTRGGTDTTIDFTDEGGEIFAQRNFAGKSWFFRNVEVEDGDTLKAISLHFEPTLKFLEDIKVIQKRLDGLAVVETLARYIRLTASTGDGLTTFDPRFDARRVAKYDDFATTPAESNFVGGIYDVNALASNTKQILFGNETHHNLAIKATGGNAFRIFALTEAATPLEFDLVKVSGSNLVIHRQATTASTETITKKTEIHNPIGAHTLEGAHEASEVTFPMVNYQDAFGTAMTFETQLIANGNDEGTRSYVLSPQPNNYEQFINDQVFSQSYNNNNRQTYSWHYTGNYTGHGDTHTMFMGTDRLAHNANFPIDVVYVRMFYPRSVEVTHPATFDDVTALPVPTGAYSVYVFHA